MRASWSKSSRLRSSGKNRLEVLSELSTGASFLDGEGFLAIWAEAVDAPNTSAPKRAAKANTRSAALKFLNINKLITDGGGLYGCKEFLSQVTPIDMPFDGYIEIMKDPVA